MTNLFSSFLDDYFAECDEHLMAIRQNLLFVEPYVNQPLLSRSILDKLFGSFHSIKGLSGMVGVNEAEQLAHEMESYLRALRDNKVVLITEGLDALLSGTKILEEVITAYRIQNPAPDIVPICDRFRTIFTKPEAQEQEQSGLQEKVELNLSGQSTPTVPDTQPKTLKSLKLKPEESIQLAAALEEGNRAWQFEFLPGTEKAARGINVNTVRQRLQSIGELIHAEPIALENGGIAFDFIVVSHADTDTFADWEKDGITYLPYSQQEIKSQTSNVKSQNEEWESGITPEPQHPRKAENLDRLSPTPPLVPSPTALFTVAPSNVVRVDLARLDELMQMVGELVITRSRLEDNLNNLKPILPASHLRTLRETNLTLERQLRDLREGVMRVRMVPIGEIFVRMQFAIRDLVKQTQKQVVLEVSGETTEIDKFIVERMINPLLHLVRNAVSHGLEEQQERVRCGKSPQGKIALRAATVGEMVTIEIEDDGRGVDVEAVTSSAREQGSLGADTTLSSETLLDLICSSGFSTRKEADLTSGRGVGMTIVKNTVTELGGFLSLDTQVGRGTRFIIQLPLTLAIADALIVSVSGQTFAIPLSSVHEITQVPSADVTLYPTFANASVLGGEWGDKFFKPLRESKWENNEMIAHRGTVLPLLRLARIFNLENEIPSSDAEDNLYPTLKKELNTQTNIPQSINSQSLLNLIVVGNGFSAAAIVVDRILGQREIVVRPLTDPLVQVRGIAGATELGDGYPVLILDIIALTRAARIKN
ncbi:chemotaxis protein CheA [Aerosakkonema sp. BLCC-F183]|uniref:chemotaxis protein CheA n=1 Tax=Aerosakkonema sp. BLCC-F183 TaxID=3342834 RepID=UPI0035B8018F